MMRALSVAMVIAVLAIVTNSPAQSSNGAKVVHFESASVPSIAGQADQEEGFPVWGHLRVPEGAGPFPAVVLMHGCGGIQNSHGQWADLLAEAGFVTLIVDSLGPRGLIRACDGKRHSVSPAARSLDAFGALHYLSEQPFVDQSNIGVIGWSDGGVAALGATNRSGIGEKFDRKFAAAIAFYPYCISDRRFDLPILILIGEADEWTPAGYCRDLEAYGRSTGAPIDLHVYPGVHHGFDEPELRDGLALEGADGVRRQLKYDDAAHQDSIQRVSEYLQQHLSLN